MTTLTTTASWARTTQGPLTERGPVLLQGADDPPGLEAHLERFGSLPLPDLDTLAALADAADARGRGGAGFPFATKLRATAGRRRAVVVVNASEGEPASAKDAALLLCAPHLVLDGAAATAHALGTREVHVVVPSERPHLRTSVERALKERRRSGERLSVQIHSAAARFVAGQSNAVLELMAGRPNLPVTAWTPAAVSGHGGRPTLLSNAETFAQVASLLRLGARDYSLRGTVNEPGTTLLTVDGDGPAPTVLEVEYGTSIADVVGTPRPVLLGGYHGTWATTEQVASLRFSRQELSDAGLTLGAGVVLPLSSDQCPVERTEQILAYLASQSARRCGPCLNGLPALAAAFSATIRGRESTARVRELCGLVERRGACAHPDGTARLVRSLLVGFDEEVDAHAARMCLYRGGSGE